MGLSCRKTGRELGRNHVIISRLIRRCQQTNDVKNRNRSGQPHKTSPQEDRALLPRIAAILLRRSKAPINTIKTSLLLQYHSYNNITAIKL